MSQMDHATLLTRLIIASELALQMRVPAEMQSVAETVQALQAESRKPVDRERVIGEDIVLCGSALLFACAELNTSDRRRAAIFLRVVGVLLPEVRIALAVAIEQRRRPTP